MPTLPTSLAVMTWLGLLATWVPEHLGPLHTYEKLLVALVAFGPFVVLFVVAYVVHRRDQRADAADPDVSDASGAAGSGAADPGRSAR